MNHHGGSGRGGGGGGLGRRAGGYEEEEEEQQVGEIPWVLIPITGLSACPVRIYIKNVIYIKC